MRPSGRRSLRETQRSPSSRKAARVHFVISEVPHKKQRYETVGDWIPGKPVKIRISKMKDKRYVFLVALHEMLEYELCRMKGISDRSVVDFDVNFEMERRRRLHSPEAEPGDDPRAPYKEQHGFATEIERMVARKLGVRWTDYERTVLALSRRRRALGRQLVSDVPQIRSRDRPSFSTPLSWRED